MRIFLRQIILLCGILLTISHVSGQSLSYVDPKALIQREVSLGPDVGNLGRFAMSPPDFSNGQPQQQISLFEIRENGISYPINLFYSYSGFRVKEEATSVGLGWGITEGVIIRIVKHAVDENLSLMKRYEQFLNFDDEIGPGYVDPAYFTNPSYVYDYNYTWNRLFYKLYDGQPDLYVYSFGNYKGKFLWINGEAVNLEYNDIQIKGKKNALKVTFKLTTPDGVEYTFEEADRSSTNPASIIEAQSCDHSIINTYSEGGFTTAWRLHQIENKTTQSKMEFTYAANLTAQNKNIDQATSLTVISTESFEGYRATDFKKDELYSRSITETHYITEIESNNYLVSFTTANRSDGGQKRITGLKVFNKQSGLTTPVKEITFDQSYFGNTSNPQTCWLKLKGVGIEGGGSDMVYQFDYINETASGINLDKEKLSIDHWGYFNNQANSTLIPLTPIIQSQLEANSNLGLSIVAWANRNPNLFFTKYFALEKVTYPTKGYTKITYESANARGIRVVSQEDFDGQSSSYKYYDYGDPGFVIAPNYDYEEYLYHQYCGDDVPPNSMIRTYGSTPSGPGGFLENSDNFYPKVTEYIGTADGQGGRTIYTYQKYNSEIKLKEKAHFKYGSVDTIAKEKYDYSGVTIKDIEYWRQPIMLETGFRGGPCNLDTWYRPSCGVKDPDKHYILGSLAGGTNVVSAYWIRLVRVEKYNGQSRTVTNYQYRAIEAATGRPLHTQPIKIDEYRSDGQYISTFYHYAGEPDPDNPSLTLGIQQMWNPSNAKYKHFIAPPIKTRVFTGSKLLYKQINQYTYDSVNDLVLNTGTEEWPAGNVNGKVIQNHSYDSKGYLKQTDNGYKKRSFLWDYNNQYLVAEVKNTVQADMAYTSFEAENKGNWTYSGATIADASAPTGKRAYNLSGGTISKNGLTSTRKYLLIYWAKSTAAAGISGGTATAMRNRNGWTQYKRQITGATSVSINGSVAVDDIRFHPIDAIMTTYTYDPLEGITNQTDEKGAVLYYEYDSFQRLKAVKDLDGNIVETYNYHYKTP